MAAHTKAHGEELKGLSIVIFHEYAVWRRLIITSAGYGGVPVFPPAISPGYKQKTGRTNEQSGHFHASLGSR